MTNYLTEAKPVDDEEFERLCDYVLERFGIELRRGLKNTVDLICEVCGGTYDVWPCRAETSRYCSNDCKYTALIMRGWIRWTKNDNNEEGLNEDHGQ